MNWKRLGPGTYGHTDRYYDVIVHLDGELWRSKVYLEGVLIDAGEWDSRDAAFRNAEGAYRRAQWLRRRIPIAEQASE